MDELKHKVDDLTKIDQTIVHQLSAFSGTVIQFQSTVTNLAINVATLSSEVKHLRQDIDETKEIKKQISVIENILSQNKGSWLAVVAIGSSFVAMVAVITALAEVFLRK